MNSLGEPIERDEKIAKAKIEETLKYDQTSQYRFGTRIFVENGIVVGWDLKGGQPSSGTPSEAYEVQTPEPSREFDGFIGNQTLPGGATPAITPILEADEQNELTDFWKQLLEYANQQTDLHAHVNPSKATFIGHGAGRAGLSYCYRI